MSDPPRPDPKPASPLDKLSKDLAQYQQAQKRAARPAPAAPSPAQPAQPRPAQPPLQSPPARSADEPPPRPQMQPGRSEVRPSPRPVRAGARSARSSSSGWIEIDYTLGSQIGVYLLIGGYAVLMMILGVAVMMLAPSSSPALWPILAIGVIVSMIASHKGRPPLLWFLYGSVVPVLPLLAGVIMALASRMTGAMAGPGLDALGAVLGTGTLAAPPAAAAPTIDLFLCVCVIGLIPVVHALLAERNPAVVDARRLARGMKKCPACAEIIRPDAKVCRYCRKDLTVQDLR